MIAFKGVVKGFIPVQREHMYFCLEEGCFKLGVYGPWYHENTDGFIYARYH